MSVSELRWAGSQAGGPAAHGKTAYLPYIDGLRAWAVLSVMLYHLDARWLPGGFAGVDIFFVISGFVVSVSVANRGPMSLGPFLLFFYARRMRRILPALVAALLATALVSTLFIPASYLSDRNRTTGLLAFFGLSNVILGAPGGDYFSPKAEFNPYTHTWSLGVEEQFYLLFPLLFHAWRAGGKRRYASAALFAAGLCASLAWSVWARPAMHAQAFYLIFGRFWELAAGVLLYQCVARAGRPAGRPAAAFGIEAGVWASAVAVLAGFVASKPALYPFPGALVPVAGALGLLGLLHGRARASPVRAALEQPALRFVGRISYSLYLWHWPVFVVFRWTLGLDSAGGKTSALLVACALATASYRFIETPLRRGGAAARRAPRVAALAGGGRAGGGRGALVDAGRRAAAALAQHGRAAPARLVSVRRRDERRVSGMRRGRRGARRSRRQAMDLRAQGLRPPAGKPAARVRDRRFARDGIRGHVQAVRRAHGHRGLFVQQRGLPVRQPSAVARARRAGVPPVW